jgi:acetolactate synthase-1/2/3 large subunit
MSSNLLSGAKILLHCLTAENVECIFGYPGGVTLPLYDALYDYPIKHVLVRHEQNAAFAAQGYARTTGKVGVCCATSGPGATNLVTGLVDAMMDSIPIVALTGQVSSKLMGSDAFQEADTFGITRSATKHNFLVLSRGFRAAGTGAGGCHQGCVSGSGALFARNRNSLAWLQGL